MPDIAEVLARPDVIRFVEDLIFQAAKTAGVNQTHAERIALGMKSRLEAGEKVDQLVAIADALRDNKSLRSAFIEGMDKCRETKDAYGEWPSLEGRVDLANDAYPVEE